VHREEHEKKTLSRTLMSDEIQKESPELLNELRQLIEKSRAHVISVVNTSLTMLYWQIGKRIHENILKGERADYGKQIVQGLSAQLQVDYGKGFSGKNLRRMIQFSTVFSDKQIVVSLIRQLSWTHFLALIPLKDDLQRDFYAEMCSLEKWSVRTLRERIDSMLFERTALSKKPEECIKNELAQLSQQGGLSPNLIFKDPYILDFLELNDHYYEKDLEDAILRELENFLLELGAGFSFIGRQQRVHIGKEDFYIDLLFYNRQLKRLIAIDLKLGDFKAAYKGQMELYLRYLAKHEQQDGELSPLGLILCAGKDEEQIELLELDKSGIHVAEYLTGLPSRELLQEKLHKAIVESRKRFENRSPSEQGL
jgi:predicted nuclease of restriction endonuclease-like (RecB) superfamily